MLGLFLKTYAVYAKPGDVHPLESAVLVKEGFSIWVYIFNIFWAVYYQVWSLAVIIISFYVLSKVALDVELIDFRFRLFLELGFMVWVAFAANDFRGKALMRRGYVLMDVVLARSVDEARQRLFDRYLKEDSVVSKRPARAAAKAAA